MARQLQTISEGTPVTGSVYYYDNPSDEQTPVVAYPMEALVRMSDEELKDIDLEWVDVADPEPSYNSKVVAELDRRLRQGYIYQSHRYAAWNDTEWLKFHRPMSRAIAAIQGGAVADEMDWDEAGTNFTYISADGTPVELDAPDMVDLGARLSRWYDQTIAKSFEHLTARPELTNKKLADDDNWPSYSDGSVYPEVE